MCCAALPSAARWRLCSSWRRPGLSSDRLGGLRSHPGPLPLAPLDRAKGRKMMGGGAARHALPREIVDNVAARTGGVPLFVEEVTRLLLERGGLSGIQTIPPTLQ